MSDYRRWFVPGAMYFFTAVTHGRRPILTDDVARPILRGAFTNVRRRWPFDSFAMVLLPDHLHTVWKLPQGDARFPLRWARIKSLFTTEYLLHGGEEGPRSSSRRKRRERGIWQRRGWEHVIRDSQDLKHHVDYIHWNPVKHGYVERVRDWPWSSFHRFVKQGEYDLNWGTSDPWPEKDFE